MKNISNLLSIVMLVILSSAGAQNYNANNKQFVPIIEKYDSLSPIRLRNDHYSGGGASKTKYGKISYNEQDEKYIGQSISLPQMTVFKYPENATDSFQTTIMGGEYVIAKIFDNELMSKFALIGDAMLNSDHRVRAELDDIKNNKYKLPNIGDVFNGEGGGMFTIRLVELTSDIDTIIVTSKDIHSILWAQFYADFNKAKRSEQKKMQWDPQNIIRNGVLINIDTLKTSFVFRYPVDDRILIKDTKPIKNRQYTITKVYSKDEMGLFYENIEKEEDRLRQKVLNSYNYHYFNHNSSPYLDGLAELVGVEKRDTIILALSGIHQKSFLSLGYYKKMTDMYKNAEFIIQSSVYNTGQFYIEDYFTKEKLPVDSLFVNFTEAKLGLSHTQPVIILGCKSGKIALPLYECLQIKNEHDMPDCYWRLVVGGDNEAKKKYLESKKFYYIKTKNYYLFDKRILEVLRRDLVKLYGSKYSTAIINGYILSGMTMDMCKQAWGEKNWGIRSSNNEGTGRWEHKKGNITFKYGKVVEVTQ